MLVDTGGTPSTGPDSDLERVVESLAGAVFVKDLITFLAAIWVLCLSRMVESSAHVMNQLGRREPLGGILAQHELEHIITELGAPVGKGCESVISQKAISSGPDERGKQVLKTCVAVDVLVCRLDGTEQVAHVWVRTSTDLIDGSMAARLGDIVATDLH